MLQISIYLYEILNLIIKTYLKTLIYITACWYNYYEVEI